MASAARPFAGLAPPIFVVQKHKARQLHYDFRLEIGGVLVSWAIPKGPSVDPQVRRLAVHVEDHALAYGEFEGRIGSGEYGAGTVIVWDYGRWESDGDANEGLRSGRLAFMLRGEKLKGSWGLTRLRGEPKNWLLVKGRDEAGGTADVTLDSPQSALSGKTIDEVERDPNARVIRCSEIG